MQSAFHAYPGRAVHHKGIFKHVMALALNPQTQFKDGVIRCITRREGSVDVSGFVDHSELFCVQKRGRHEYGIQEPLCIHNEEEIVESLTPGEGYEFLGLEDPDLIQDEHGVLHLYFTMPFINRTEGASHIYLGHAEGPNLHTLTMTAPVLASDKATAKEVSLVPPSSGGTYHHLIESSAPGTEHSAYSTVRVATATTRGPYWDFGKTLFHPAHRGLEWAGGHASPGPFLPRSFIDVGEGKLVGFLNGRERDRVVSEQVVFGAFTVGLFIYDYEHGEIVWVSECPVIQDVDAHTITFASQFVEAGVGEGILYAHVDDSFVRAYKVTRETLRALIT